MTKRRMNQNEEPIWFEELVQPTQPKLDQNVEKITQVNQMIPKYFISEIIRIQQQNWKQTCSAQNSVPRNENSKLNSKIFPVALNNKFRSRS